MSDAPRRPAFGLDVYHVVLHTSELAAALAGPRADQPDCPDPAELELPRLLGALVEWEVLDRSQDGTRATTLAEYRNRHSVYQFTEAGYRAHRAVESVLSASMDDTTLSRLVFADLRGGGDRARSDDRGSSATPSWFDPESTSGETTPLRASTAADAASAAATAEAEAGRLPGQGNGRPARLDRDEGRRAALRARQLVQERAYAEAAVGLVEAELGDRPLDEEQTAVLLRLLDLALGARIPQQPVTASALGVRLTLTPTPGRFAVVPAAGGVLYLDGFALSVRLPTRPGPGNCRCRYPAAGLHRGRTVGRCARAAGRRTSRGDQVAQRL